MSDIKILGKLAAGRADGVLLDDKSVVGGYKVVANKSELDALPTATLPNGTPVYVSGESKTYRRLGGQWVEEVAGGGSTTEHDANCGFFVVQTEAEKPTSGVSNGMFCYVYDTNALYRWNQVGWFTHSFGAGGTIYLANKEYSSSSAFIEYTNISNSNASTSMKVNDLILDTVGNLFKVSLVSTNAFVDFIINLKSSGNTNEVSTASSSGIYEVLSTLGYTANFPAVNTSYITKESGYIPVTYGIEVDPDNEVINKSNLNDLSVEAGTYAYVISDQTYYVYTGSEWKELVAVMYSGEATTVSDVYDRQILKVLANDTLISNKDSWTTLSKLTTQLTYSNLKWSGSSANVRYEVKVYNKQIYLKTEVSITVLESEDVGVYSGVAVKYAGHWPVYLSGGLDRSTIYVNSSAIQNNSNVVKAGDFLFDENGKLFSVTSVTEDGGCNIGYLFDIKNQEITEYRTIYDSEGGISFKDAAENGAYIDYVPVSGKRYVICASGIEDNSIGSEKYEYQCTLCPEYSSNRIKLIVNTPSLMTRCFLIISTVFADPMIETAICTTLMPVNNTYNTNNWTDKASTAQIYWIREY